MSKETITLEDALKWGESDGEIKQLGKKIEQAGPWGSAGDNALEVLCKHYRKLERERNELRENLEIMRDKYRMHHDEAERLTKDNTYLRELIRNFVTNDYLPTRKIIFAKFKEILL